MEAWLGDHEVREFPGSFLPGHERHHPVAFEYHQVGDGNAGGRRCRGHECERPGLVLHQVNTVGGDGVVAAVVPAATGFFLEELRLGLLDPLLGGKPHHAQLLPPVRCGLRPPFHPPVGHNGVRHRINGLVVG